MTVTSVLYEYWFTVVYDNSLCVNFRPSYVRLSIFTIHYDYTISEKSVIIIIKIIITKSFNCDTQHVNVFTDYLEL